MKYLHVCLECVYRIAPILCIVVLVLIILQHLIWDVTSTYSTLSPGNDYMLMDLCNQQTFFGKKKGQCIASVPTCTNITLVRTTDCQDLNIETETVHTTSTFNGYQWESLQSSLYIINADSAMVNYTITTIPAAEPSTVIEALVFDDVTEYAKSQLGNDGASYIKNITLSQTSNLGIITFPRNKTIYFIALKKSQANVTNILIDSKIQRSYYSFSGPTVNKTCSNATECGISYKQGECVLVNTSSLTELEIRSEPDIILFQALSYVYLGLFAYFTIIQICKCTYSSCCSHKKKVIIIMN